MSTIKIPTNEKIKASFIFPAFSQIVCEPSYNIIKMLKTQDIYNAAIL